MDCTSCGAPLPARSTVCQFCSKVNDVDLRRIHANTTAAPLSDRICPRCEKPMPTIDVLPGETFLIEQCSDCKGLFFDPNELEALIDKSVDHVYDVDHQRIQTLIEEEGRPDMHTVRYVRCPVCQKVMNRRSYGAKSGVIVDQCRDHGVWLDGGELNLILKWTKAGGQILEQKRQEEDRRSRERREAQQRRQSSAEFDGMFTTRRYSRDDDTLWPVLNFVFRMFH